jgi:hypothetical protein
MTAAFLTEIALFILIGRSERLARSGQLRAGDAKV